MALTEDDLKTLADFNMEEDGTYTDRFKFCLIYYPFYKQWALYHASEVDDSKWFIKFLKDMDDLKNVYLAIMNEPLEIRECSK